jgi:hypothetical protein
MKGSVIQNYIDAQTGKAYSIGDKVEYADDRARFLAEKGYVKLADVPKAEPVVEAEVKAEPKKVPKPRVTPKKSGKK